jgi:hypothetical protein
VQEKTGLCLMRVAGWEVSWEQELYVMTASREAFGMEAVGKASRELGIVAVEDIGVAAA